LFFGSENLRTPIYEKGFRFALQKRCHRFACFGQEKKDGTSKALAEFCMLWASKKNDFKSVGGNSYELGGTSKALGENSMFDFKSVGAFLYDLDTDT